MTKEELELKISGLEKAIATCKDETSGYENSLKTSQQQLKDLGKIALPPVIFDDIYEAVDNAVCEYDFNDSGNYNIEYGIEYDGKVYAESIELQHNSDLIEAIVEKVSKIFTEAECPEELDTTEDDNHPVEKLQN
tara:strand:+ start:138 stop:542 length:405 start_codon:yes stop_codon:yes gene_type:complete